jgi:hypothetical protein
MVAARWHCRGRGDAGHPSSTLDPDRIVAWGESAGGHLYLYEDADHMWLGSPDAASEALTGTVAFLRKQLIERDRR